VNERNQPDFLDPHFEPGEFDRVERELRQVLTREVARLSPSDRLDDILHEARTAGPAHDRSPRRWLVPVAAAATVAVIGGGVWATTQGDSPEPTPPVGTSTPSVTSPDSPTVPQTSSPGPSATATDLPTTAGTTAVSLPVYFVGPIGDPQQTSKLFREFVGAQLPTGASAEERAKAALVIAVNAQPWSNTAGYLQPWSGQTIGAVSVTPTAITVDLANAGNPQAAVTAEVQRLAVQELVWTAQAAAQSSVPVRFTVRGQATRLFGSIATDQGFTRPPSDQLYEDVAPIWITAPSRDQVLPAAKAVTVTGQAIVFEANVSWQLKRGSTQVKTGNAMASVGAPMQGTYTVDLGVLAPGDYTIRVFEMSMQDGDKVAGEVSTTFTVR
jgi:hypothetical protein